MFGHLGDSPPIFGNWCCHTCWPNGHSKFLLGHGLLSELTSGDQLVIQWWLSGQQGQLFEELPDTCWPQKFGAHYFLQILLFLGKVNSPATPLLSSTEVHMTSMKLVIRLHFILWKKDSKRCCDTTTPGSIHTKDESKRGSAFAFIFGVNWPLQ